MKVRMKSQASGPGVNLKPGHVYDLDDKFAADLFEGGYADILPVKEFAESAGEESAEDEIEVETADAAGAPETAEGPGNRRGKKKAGRK